MMRTERWECQSHLRIWLVRNRVFEPCLASFIVGAREEIATGISLVDVVIEVPFIDFLLNVRHQFAQNTSGSGSDGALDFIHIAQIGIYGELSAGHEAGGDLGQVLKGFLRGELDLIFWRVQHKILPERYALIGNIHRAVRGSLASLLRSAVLLLSFGGPQGSPTPIRKSDPILRGKPLWPG
jgi:hypothetical protein